MITNLSLGNDKEQNDAANEAERLFLDKMTILNRSFLSFIQRSVKELPDGDLTPSLHDYLKHVNELDQAYGNGIMDTSAIGDAKKVDVQPSTASSSLNILASINAPVVSNASLQVGTKKIGDLGPKIPDDVRNDSKNQVLKPANRSTPYEFVSQDTRATNKSPQNSLQAFSINANLSTNSAASTPVSDSSERRGKKRAKRGGPEGADDEVIVSQQPVVSPNSHNWKTSFTSVEEINKYQSLPIVVKSSIDSTEVAKKSCGSFENTNINFFTSDSSKTLNFNSSLDVATSPVGLSKGTPFGFKVPRNIQTDVIGPNSIVTASSSLSTSTFSSIYDSNAPLFSLSKDRSSFGQSEDSKKKLFLFGKAPEQQGTAETSKNIVSETASSKLEQPKSFFSFLKPSDKEDSAAKMNEGRENLKSGLQFGFSSAGAAPKLESGEKEDSEYVPPKPEVVITDEPDSVLSLKCSVFVLKGSEYDKLGIGQLHVKKSKDNKKIFLVRAATTVGTVWVNCFVDDNMKCWKVDKAKLRISCLSENTPATYLIRLPTESDREKLEKEIDANSFEKK